MRRTSGKVRVQGAFLLNLLVVGFVAASPGAVHADASKGELFGYQIGQQYRADSTTKLTELDDNKYLFRIFPSASVKPVDLGPVYIDVTVKTLTIVRIGSATTAWTEDGVAQLARKYGEIMRAQYPKVEPNNHNFGSGLSYAWGQVGSARPFLTMTVEKKPDWWKPPRHVFRIEIFKLNDDALMELGEREGRERILRGGAKGL